MIHLVVLIHAIHIVGLAMFGMALATGGPVGNARKRTYTVDTGATVTPGLGMIQGVLDESVTNPTGANQPVLGVVDYAPFEASTALSLVIEGECLALCSAAINAGQWVKADANGYFVPSITIGDQVIGRARTSTVSSGDQFVLDVHPFVL